MDETYLETLTYFLTQATLLRKKELTLRSSADRHLSSKKDISTLVHTAKELRETYLEILDEPEKKYLNGIIDHHFHLKESTNDWIEIEKKGTVPLDTPIKDIMPDTRARFALMGRGTNYLGQLIVLSENDLLKFRNLGKGTLRVIKSTVESLGYHLDTKIDYTPPEERTL